MAPNLLITGAAGYIGGTVLRSLLSANVIPPLNIWAIVRSDAQAESLRPLYVNIAQVSLTDNEAVKALVIDNNIEIVIHTASAVDPTPAIPLLEALRDQKQQTNQPVHFIHTSGVSAFADKTGWPHGAAKESDDLLTLQRDIAVPYPIRETDVAIHQTGTENGVAVYTVVPPLVYGKGAGTGNRMSVQIPAVIRAAIANKQVHRFAENSEWPAVHVVDLAEYYSSLIQSIVEHRSIPSGKNGYYLVSSHTFNWHDLLSALAQDLFARNLVSSANVALWPSEGIKTKSLGIPSPYSDIAWNSNASVLVDRHNELGWQPQWDYERFLRDIDKEVDAVLEAGDNVKDLGNLLPNQS
ncbi:hypothetical protein BDV12DRAFT_202464 [Aspergillus spectabilis]